jgi:hypothetical protein
MFPQSEERYTYDEWSQIKYHREGRQRFQDRIEKEAHEAWLKTANPFDVQLSETFANEFRNTFIKVLDKLCIDGKDFYDSKIIPNGEKYKAPNGDILIFNDSVWIKQEKL